MKNLHIQDSYEITKLKDMNDYLQQHKDELGSSRSIKSYLVEWRAHNILYNLGLCISHTKNVDLNDDETILRRCVYYIIWILTLSFLEYKEIKEA